jgi:hypothetical protein
MCKKWHEAYKKYDWTVDLRKFSMAAEHEDFLNRIIQPADLVDFENRFRVAIEKNGPYQLAGEVCFWKNYGNFQARNNITKKIMGYLRDAKIWINFCKLVNLTSNNFSYDNFKILRNECNQKRGFATPITFIAFYNPIEYPMVDKHIAHWWATNKEKFGYESSPIFFQRNDGWIQAVTNLQTEQNCEAYLEWKQFCIDYAKKLNAKCNFNWRARDVEMAVWESEKNGISLETM